MGYGLGVDLGTTFTAAAVSRGPSVSVAALSEDDLVAPSVVLAAEDGSLFTGQAAEWRAIGDPLRVARGFKRRLGDPTPLVIGGTPYAPTALMAALLRDVVASVTASEGEPPEHVVLTCPAVWGPYRREQFTEVPRLAGLNEVTLLTEPEAAAAHHVRERRLADGEIVAVYDLGGGTFDTTVLRARPDGMEILGTPEGIERLGGIDFDEALIAHVDAELDGAFGRLDPRNPAEGAAMALLRRECVRAKELLSTEDSVTIVARLPGGRHEVTVTRARFEEMIRRSIGLTVETVRRTLVSAGVEPDELAAIVLAGGSADIPLVAETLAEEFGRPVRVGVQSKFTVALGAAATAARLGTPEQVAEIPADGAVRVAVNGTAPTGGAAPTATEAPDRAAAAAPLGAWWTDALRDRRLIGIAVVLAVLLVTGLVFALTNPGRRDQAGPGAAGAGTSTDTTPGESTGSAAAGTPPTAAIAARPSVPIPTVLTTIEAVGPRPQGVVTTPDGKLALVAASVEETVSFIDTATQKVVAELEIAGQAQYLAMSPDGTTAYVTVLRPQGKVAVIDIASRTVLREVPVGPEAFVPAASPDGTRVYVPDHNTSSVWVFPARGRSATNGQAVKSAPHGMAIGPDGRFAYVVSHESSTVTVLDLSANTTVAEIPVGISALAIALSADGKRLYTANYDANTVSVVDTEKRVVSATAQVGFHPQALALAPDGRHLYVANNGSDTVSVVETATNAVTATVYVGDEPWSVAVTPDGRFAYVANALSDDVTVISAA